MEHKIHAELANLYASKKNLQDQLAGVLNQIMILERVLSGNHPDNNNSGADSVKRGSGSSDSVEGGSGDGKDKEPDKEPRDNIDKTER